MTNMEKKKETMYKPQPVYEQVAHIELEIATAFACLESIKDAATVVIDQRNAIKVELEDANDKIENLKTKVAELESLVEVYRESAAENTIESYGEILWSATNLVDIQVMETLAECLHVQNVGAHKLLSKLERIRDDR